MRNQSSLASRLAASAAAAGVLMCVSLPGHTAEGQVIDINTASGETLAATMSGVGERLGKAIVEYRKLHGPFRSVDELVRVRGIGVKLLDRSRDQLRVGSGAAESKATTD